MHVDRAVFIIAANFRLMVLMERQVLRTFYVCAGLGVAEGAVSIDHAETCSCFGRVLLNLLRPVGFTAFDIRRARGFGRDSLLLCLQISKIGVLKYKMGSFGEVNTLNDLLCTVCCLILGAIQKASQLHCPYTF